MSEKLVIKNFGPIKHVDLDIKKVNVLIGDQGTGKSTVAKVLAICRYFSYIIDLNPNSLLAFHTFIDGLTAWGLDEAKKDDSYIYYDCYHYTVTFENTSTNTINVNDEISFKLNPFKPKLQPKSIEFTNLLQELNNIKPLSDNELKNWNIPTSFFLNDVKRVLDNPFYLPTERGLQSVFSLGKSSIENISDSLFNQLSKLDKIARNFTKVTDIEPLKISYKNIDGKGLHKKEHDENFYSLYNGASGYQSTIPVVLVLKYFIDIKERNRTFIIEEPEINLFPTTQNELIKFIIEKCSQDKSRAFLTTHSPYILTSLNNLMQAFIIGENNAEKVNEIIDKKYWLNPKEVSAYMLTTDGTAENIIAEDGLIMTEKIDAVSDVLNGLYDKLLDIKYSSN